MLREVTNNEYMYNFNNKNELVDYDLNDIINTSKYSDIYYALDNDAYVGVEYLKKGIVRLNGLFSLEPSRGRELVDILINEFKSENRVAIVLDCTKDLRDKYYRKNWSFLNSWNLTKINYYELVMFL